MINLLEKYTHLKNRYFVMRHGQSLANVKGLVVSTPENGIPSYGLSSLGKQQVRTSLLASQLINADDTATVSISDIQIISSDFKRARETSEIAAEIIGTNQQIRLDSKLRERNFGDFELHSDTNYQKTWADDAISSAHTNHNVESAEAVMQRVTSLIVNLEENYNKAIFLLVAHGDTLQILQTAFKKQSASKQRELTHLETAEIRELTIS